MAEIAGTGNSVNPPLQIATAAPIGQEPVVVEAPIVVAADPGRRLAGSLVLFLLFLLTFNFIAVAPMLPLIIEAFGISQASASLLVGVVSLSLAAGMLPGGMLVARLGVRKSLVIAGFLLSAGLLTPLTPDYPTLLALRITFSAGGAILLPASVVLIMQWFPPRELPIWNAASGAVQSFGLTASTVLAAPLAATIGWRSGLALFGGLAFAGAVFWLFFGKEHPLAPARGPSSGGIRAVVRNRVTWLLALAFAGPIGQMISLATWLPAYYQTVRGFSVEEAGALVGLLTFVGIPGTILGGILPQRLGVRRPFILGSGAIVGIAGAGTYLADSPPLIVLALIVAGACSMLFFPVLTTTAMELPGMTPSTLGVVLGLAIGLANGMGFIAPFVVGLSADLTGSLVPGFLVWSAGSLSLFVAGMMLPETGRRAAG